jgi:cyclopropane-fatty-acyl-phospholipid synthase
MDLQMQLVQDFRLETGTTGTGMDFSTTHGHAGLPRWCETVFGIIQGIEYGQLSFTLPDGRTFTATGDNPGPSGHFNIRNTQLFTRMVRDGETGFAEAYMDGWWDSPDLQALLDVCLMNNDQVARGFTGAGLVRAYERLRHWLRTNTKRGSRKNIAHHYDLGNEFYGHWLDPSMTYSSALYSGQGETLQQAQMNKYASICDQLRLKPGDRVLEIGCGWGGIAE